jgi:2-polyprenyl-6-methoxyphenol hydroxylase-like FAD-dependent oxidoreductase
VHETGAAPGRAGASPPAETEVLVVGGGPSGLAAALELGRRGVRCLLVEPRRDISELRPRAKTTSVRTMEHFRRWGLAHELRAASYLPVAWSQDVVFCTNLLGVEITRFTGCFGLTTERSPLFAETSQQVPQFVVERLLRDAVGAEPSCTALYGWSASAIDEHDGEVAARLEAPGLGPREVRASIVLGCDGGSSVVRTSMGIRYEGRVDERRNLTAVFRAHGLAELVPHGPAIQYWVLQPGASAYMGRLDLADRWWIGLIGVGDALDEDAVRAAIQLAVGAPVDVEVVGTDPWTSRMLVAERFGSDRVFLCGDAAHLNPPWGGHGFNTGIGDAVNVAWKVAAVSAGWGGRGLLASYEEERRPVAVRTVALAGRHAGLLSADFADPVLLEDSARGGAARTAAAKEIDEKKYDEFHGLGLVLGYDYEASRVVVADPFPASAEGRATESGDPASDDVSRYVPCARPGHRLPHAWLSDAESVYDRLGPWFTLLRAGEADPVPFVAAAARQRLPLQVEELRGAGLDLGAPLVLVRPDQHVAWRGTSAAGADDVVRTVRGAPLP